MFATANFGLGSGGFLCSGTVVGPRHIVTAAHCVARIAVEKRGDGTNTYDAEVFYPEPADEMQPGRTLRVTNARKAPVDASQEPWVSVTIASTSLSPPWLARSSETVKPEYGDLLGGDADVAVIEVRETLKNVLDGIQPAVIDTRPVSAGEVVTATGFGCEESVITPEGVEQTNWKDTVTGELGRTRVVTPQRAADADWDALSKEYEASGFTKADVLAFYEANAKGYLVSLGPAVPRRKGGPRVGGCPGDSGGGLFRGVGDREVVGVVSGSGYGVSGPTLIEFFARFDGQGGVADWLKGAIPGTR